MKFAENQTFKDLTTFHTGGKIKYFIEVRDVAQIREVVSFAKNRRLPIFIIGGGSDILAGDKNFDGVVMRYVGKVIKTQKLNDSEFLASAEAGAIWDDLVKYAVSRNLQGIECLSGIPGTVGAAPIQNIGAYGQELGDVFVSLRAYDIVRKKVVEFNKRDCQFSYRESIFKNKKYRQKFIITNVTLKLGKNKKPEVKYDSLKNYLTERGIKNPSLTRIRLAVCDIRANKFEDPKDVGNAGSFFKNPIMNGEQARQLKEKYPEIELREQENGNFKGFAGWFIERAGWKGKTYKNAGVSSKHALILVNRNGKATSQDVFELSEKIISDVYKKFGIKLEREVRFVNI